MMNPKKRQASWDKCKNNAKAPKDWQPLALKYFMKHGFTGPNYVKPAVNFINIGLSKLPTKDALMAKLQLVKNRYDEDLKRYRAQAIAKTKFGGKSRRRKKSKKRKRTRRRR